MRNTLLITIFFPECLLREIISLIVLRRHSGFILLHALIKVSLT